MRVKYKYIKIMLTRLVLNNINFLRSNIFNSQTLRYYEMNLFIKKHKNFIITNNRNCINYLF